MDHEAKGKEKGTASIVHSSRSFPRWEIYRGRRHVVVFTKSKMEMIGVNRRKVHKKVLGETGMYCPGSMKEAVNMLQLGEFVRLVDGRTGTVEINQPDDAVCTAPPVSRGNIAVDQVEVVKLGVEVVDPGSIKSR